MAKVGQGRKLGCSRAPFSPFIKHHKTRKAKSEKRKKGLLPGCLVWLTAGRKYACLPCPLCRTPPAATHAKAKEGSSECSVYAGWTERYPGPVVGFNVGDDDRKGPVASLWQPAVELTCMAMDVRATAWMRIYIYLSRPDILTS